MSYCFRLSQRPDGFDVAETEFDGRTLRAETRHGATMAISRLLISAGAPDGPWEGVDSGTDARRLYGRSVVALAGLTISETDKHRGIVKWVSRDFPREDAAA
jgi:hypothetical protein